MKKSLLAIFVITLTLVCLSVSLLAETTNIDKPIVPQLNSELDETPGPNDVIITPPPGSTPITVTGYDENQEGTKGTTILKLKPKPQKDEIALGGMPVEEYSYTSYTYKYYTITKHGAGPMINSEVFLTLPAGASQTKHYKFEAKASIQYGGEASTTIKKLVNLAFKSDFNGSLNLLLEFTETLTGPTDGYSTRVFYKGTDHDNADVYANATDHYDLYYYNNGRRILGESNYSQRGPYTKKVASVKRPYLCKYSKIK